MCMYFDLEHIKVISMLFGPHFSKCAHTSDTAHGRAKCTKNSPKYLCVKRTFASNMLRYLGSFSALILKLAGNSKLLIAERSR